MERYVLGAMNLRTVALLGNVLKKVPASGVPFPILLSFLNRRQEKSYLRKEFESKTKFVVRYAVIDVSTRHSLRDWSWRWLEHEQNRRTFRHYCRCRTVDTQSVATQRDPGFVSQLPRTFQHVAL